jgi:rRNA maturation RNase YbeY
MTSPVSRSKVSFHDLAKAYSLRNRKALKLFIPTIFQVEKKQLAELSVIFCTDEYLLRINEEYLHHHEYTDIITFDLSDKSAKIKGEIYISLDRVNENASLYNTSPSDELHRVIFHGILHLCGYSDKTLQEQKLMRTREGAYLKKYQRFVSRETRST